MKDNKAKPKMAKSNSGLNTLYLVYFFQIAFLLLVFFTAKGVFGYICLASLVLQQLFAIVLNNILPYKERPILFAVLSFLSGGFMAIVRIFSDSEKKGSLTASRLQMMAICIQAISIFSLFYIWMFNTPKYIWFSLIASAAVSLIILFSGRDPEEKLTAVLIIFLLFGYGYLVFLLSLPKLYFLSFKNRYDSFENKKESSRKEKKAAKSDSLVPFLSAHGFKNRKYDSAQYFPTGERFFEDVEAHLQKAKKYIYLEFFIIEDGLLFDKLFPIIKEKVKNGVEVRVICDDVGAYRSVLDNILPELITAGVKIIKYNEVIPLANTFIQYRDHRKMIVIDGEHAYLGGVNIADEYINKKRRCGYWKDAGVRVDGAIVADFELAFRKQWYAISSQRLPQHTAPSNDPSLEGVTVPYFDGLEGKLCEMIYAKAIDSAKERVTIITPYFIPGSRMLKLIKKKAREGVDISIIVPGKPDKAYVHVVTRFNVESLMKYGVRVYQMRGSFTHAKVMLADDFACIGTANFDYQSFKKSSECGIISNDSALTRDLETDISCVIEASERIDGQNCLKNNKLQYFFAIIYRLVSTLM